MKFWSHVVVGAAVAISLSVVAAAAATPAAPSAPRSLRATAGDHQVALAWSPPATGIGIDYYLVSASPANIPLTTTPNTNFTATGLTNNRTYTFTVRAHNSAGAGAGAFVKATPNAIPPGPPTNLAATPTGAGQIRLDWTPPTTSGSMPDGSPATITRYNITVSPGGSDAVVPASTLTYSVSGVADNITYTFAVSATNTRPTTGAAAVVYAPLPIGATIGLSPTAGGLSTILTVTGDSFLKNESITLYWDLTTHIAATVVTDANGAFTKTIKPRALDKPGVHRLCVNVQPRPCASFAVQAPPSPTPQAPPSPVDTSTPSPSPGESPQASGARPGGGGISGLDIITRPPFVFLPIIAIIGLLGVLAYWFLSRRRSTPPSSATVVHRATRPDYIAPFPTAGSAPVPPRNPAQPSAWDAPFQPVPPAQPYVPPGQSPTWDAPAQPVPPVQPPTWDTPAPPLPPAQPHVPPPAAAPPPPPAAPDEPPDLPQPSD